MVSAQPMATIHSFGPFRLDTDAEILFRGTEPIVLGQRAVALLRLLLERAGAPVSKDAVIKAAWPGLAIEDSNLTVQIAALRRVFEEGAGAANWIEPLPRRGYRYVGPVVATGNLPAETNPQTSPALALPDKPSIAVLPFQNMSGDPEQDYFADGMVEDIITGLSRSKSLFVIARNSSFTYKGKAVDVKEVGRELGVRYILEGSVRNSGNRVRITGQLVDAETGNHIWADRYDSTLEDIFDLQDRVTTSVIGAIAPQLELAEIARAQRKPTESLQAYDYYLRALASFYRFTPEANIEALKLTRTANNLDPDYAAPFALGATCYVQRWGFGWNIADAEGETEARRLTRRALELGKDDPLVLALAGQALGLFIGELQEGAALLARAISLDPNYPHPPKIS